MKEDNAEESILRLLAQKPITRQAIKYRLAEQLPLSLGQIIRGILELDIEAQERSARSSQIAPVSPDRYASFNRLMVQIALDSGVDYPASGLTWVFDFLRMTYQPLSEAARQLLAEYLEELEANSKYAFQQ